MHEAGRHEGPDVPCCILCMGLYLTDDECFSLVASLCLSDPTYCIQAPIVFKTDAKQLVLVINTCSVHSRI